MSNDHTQQFPAPQGEPTGPSYYDAPPPPPPLPVGPPAGKPKMSKGKKWAIGIGAFLAVGLIGSIVDPPKDPGAAPVAAAAEPTSSSTPSTSLPTVAPSVQASLDKAAADKQAADAKAAADAEAKRKADEAIAAKKAADAAAKAEAAKTNPKTYAAISARNFAKVAKSPDNYIGKKYVLYGYVSQLDSATGPDTFLANLDGKNRGSDWYEYDTNSMVDAAKSGLFDDVVENDLVRLYVSVTGSESYDTQIGGNTTVPRFTAYIVKVTGSTD